jgi:hypothetical protein
MSEVVKTRVPAPKIPGRALISGAEEPGVYRTISSTEPAVTGW